MQPKKVLVVDDDKMLTTLIKMFLDELGFETMDVFSEAEKAIEKCREALPDVILMDIHLHGDIDGIKAVDMIKGEFDVPIVYITSDTEEATVNKAISTNPYGYLVKPIIKSTLGITLELAYFKHRHEQELELRERPYRKLVDDTEDTIVVIINDLIEYVNLAGLKLLGTINIEDLLQKSVLQFIKEDKRELFKNKMLFAIKSNTKMDYFETTIKALNEESYYVGIVGSPITFKRQKALQLVITDKTEELHSKGLLSEQDNIINNIHDGVASISLNGKIKTWNLGAEKIFGIPKYLIVGEHISRLYPEKNETFLQENFFEIPLEKEHHEVEIDFIHPVTLKKVYTRLSLSVLKNLADEITGIVCYCTDVTDKKIYEETIKTSANNLKAIFNGSTEAIFLIDKKLRIIDFNKLAATYTKDFFNTEISLGENIFDALTFLDKLEFSGLFSNTIDGVTHYLERQFQFPETKKYLKITIYPIVDDNEEEIDRFCISFLDISERKKIEKDLEDSRAELKPLFDSSIQRFYLVDMNHRIIAFNRAAKDVIQKEFKYSLKKGDSVVDFLLEGSGMEIFKQKFERAKMGEHVVFKEKARYDNTEYWNEVHLDPIANYKGEIYRILLWTLDITERETSHIALKQSEERYFLVAQAGNDGVWDWNLITDEMYLSPRWKSILGYNDYEIINRRDARDKLIHPDDVSKTKQKMQEYLEGRTEVYIHEYRLKHKNGEYRWIFERALALKDDNGEPYRIAGSISDITERKQYENQIYDMNKALLEERSMFIKGNVLVVRVDASNPDHVLYFSENVSNVLGYSFEDFRNKKVELSSLIHPDDYDTHMRERMDAMKKSATHVEFSNYRLRTKDGKVLWMKDFTSIIRDDKNDAIQLLGYLVDITKEKHAEQQFIESQQKYYALFSEANDIILIIDAETDKIVDVNNKAIELFGYTRNEFFNFNLLALSPEVQPNGVPSKEKRAAKIDEANKKGNSTFYWQQKRKDGLLFDAEVSLTVLTLGNKKYRHAIIRDITERVKIEKSLRESEQKNKALLKAIPDIIFILDKNGTYLDFKADYYAKFKPNKSIIGLNHRHYFEGEKLEEILSKIRKAIETTEVQTIEYQLDSPIGVRWFEARISPLNENEVLSLVRDVTERYEKVENRV
ncbi:MAG: PAS domain S-box protein [Bacteroidia bacterium]|nr:PAS domain S-box protein [Bacteroidia bacterium]